MATSSSLKLSEDQLQCSICLEVFTDPVSTPCGHNFCMVCLRSYWASSSHCQCPFCKEQFSRRPELSVNTFISGLAAQFKKSAEFKSPDEPPFKRKRVLCDYCSGVKLDAQSSCLDCGLSYCNNHLIPHKTVANLKKHKLMDPVENLEDYICQKHERPLELFCRDDQTCVCQFCIETDHRTHSTVPIEKESVKLKSQLWKTQEKVEQLVQGKKKKIEKVKRSLKHSKKCIEKKEADSVEIFRALVGCIERSQAELLEVMEEKQKAAESEAEEFIKEMEQEITELKRKNTELEQISHTEEHLHFLQVYQSICHHPPTKNWTARSVNPHPSLRRALTQLQETLSEEIEKLDETELRRIQKYAVDVIMDPVTAHPDLIISYDGKQVRDGDTVRNLCGSSQKFDEYIGVVGKEGFSSGRFYYEVQVKGNSEWELGITKESSNRKGKIKMSPENGYWTMCLRNGTEYRALDNPSVPLSLSQPPQKVGVFVDYAAGLVAFYDVGARTHIYSFNEQAFTEKLYPVFSPSVFNEDEIPDPLMITPVKQCTLNPFM
ncbi:nuclear factor 7, ovary [Astyanax mexicanus]|uniref:nuclear factor 7, ovary n=1 Tax=Astyanax mexicanus TaxID=7994 RepID=UPI0020CB2B43|nr:nuclear factor 7, ovary [Astyanax mexicanus]